MLSEAVEEECVQAFHQQIRLKGNAPGLCVDGVPWAGATAEQRLKVLHKEWTEKAKWLRDNADQAEYEAFVGVFYGSLREVWERAIEDILLNQAVVRTERAVQTQRLAKVTDFSDADYRRLEAGMAKCSTWMTGHDEAGELNEPVPEPDELLTDLTALDAWVREIKKRREKKQPKAASATSDVVAQAMGAVALLDAARNRDCSGSPQGFGE